MIRTYFRYTDDRTSLGFNIAFLNNTCKNVSSEIRRKDNRVCEYACGERLICREYTKIHDAFNVNFQYDIVKILEGKLLLKNIKSGILQAIPIENVRKSFIFASCSTCHSAQECSVDDDITIFLITIFWLRSSQSGYTVVSRRMLLKPGGLSRVDAMAQWEQRYFMQLAKQWPAAAKATKINSEFRCENVFFW